MASSESEDQDTADSTKVQDNANWKEGNECQALHEVTRVWRRGIINEMLDCGLFLVRFPEIRVKEFKTVSIHKSQFNFSIGLVAFGASWLKFSLSKNVSTFFN